MIRVAKVDFIAHYCIFLHRVYTIKRLRKTGAPVANRFQIASKITPTSYVSHHTAMEYYGITDQVYYDVYVASETSFREFEFDGYTYRYVASKDMEGVETPALSGGIRITNRERTLVDCIKDMYKIA